MLKYWVHGFWEYCIARVIFASVLFRRIDKIRQNKTSQTTTLHNLYKLKLDQISKLQIRQIRPLQIKALYSIFITVFEEIWENWEVSNGQL